MISPEVLEASTQLLVTAISLAVGWALRKAAKCLSELQRSSLLADAEREIEEWVLTIEQTEVLPERIRTGARMSYERAQEVKGKALALARASLGEQRIRELQKAVGMDAVEWMRGRIEAAVARMKK